MWYIIWCDEDTSHSLIYKTNVITAGDLKINSDVTFFYGNKPFIGTVTEMDEDYDVLKAKLKALGVTPKRTSKRPREESNPSVTLSRTRGSSSAASSKSKAAPPAIKQDTPEEPVNFKNKKILELNKKTAAMRESQSLLEKLKKDKRKPKGSDSEWQPEDDDALSSRTEQDSKRHKKERTNILKGFRQLDQEGGLVVDVIKSPTKEEVKQQTPSENVIVIRSPTKEELKKQLADSLQLLSALKPVSENIPVTETEDGKMYTGTKISVVNEEKDNVEKQNDKEPPSDQAGGNSMFDFGTNGLDDDESLNANKSPSSLNSTSEEIDHDYELSKEQLFGEMDDTVKIGKKIFCKRDVLKSALHGSTEITHVARRLIEGVFKKEAISKCTLSGMPYRAGGKDKMTEVEGLNVLAVRTIISYAKEIGKIRGWSSVKTRYIKTSMSQRLGELKRKKK